MTIPSSQTPQLASRRKHWLDVCLVIVGVSMAALISTYILFVEAPPPQKIVIATGGKNGAYFQFALKYAEELKKEGLTLEIRETAGSVENLELLNDDNSGVAIAIVQGGVADDEDRDRFQALGSLYREPLWVFYRGAAPLDRLSQLAGKRIGVGSTGSGTHAVAMLLLAANGIVESDGAGSRTVLVKDSVMAAVAALRKGELDAAFFVAGFEADYIKDLLSDNSVKLLSFAQHEAYHRKFPFLSEVTVPAGLVNLGQNLPDKNISLVAPTAILVARKNLHPTVVALFLAAATRIHNKGDELSNPGEFPSAAYTDFPLSEDADYFFKSGPSMLQRLLPSWLASRVDRLKVLLIPLVVLLMPLIRAAPPLVRWRTRRKIYLWYAALREIDRGVTSNHLSSPADIEAELKKLDIIERQISLVDVPLSYMEEFYHLRMHLRMVQENLRKLVPIKK